MRKIAAWGSLAAGFALAASTPPQPDAGDGARWITLGTSGGPAVQRERSQIANVLAVNGALYAFDAGDGIQRQMALAGLPQASLRAVFLSHHHLDHNADLGPLVVTHWLFGNGILPVFGPVGTRTLVSGIVSGNAPTVLASFPTSGPARPGLADTVSAADVAGMKSGPVEVYRDENITVTAIAVDHYQVPPSVALEAMPEAIAYRIEAGQRSIVYSGDTGPSDALRRLARDADLLVVEVVDIEGIAARLAKTMPGVPVAIRDNVVAGMRSNHLTAEEVGALASAARVRRVVLTHFVPVPEQLDEAAMLVGQVRERYSGPVEMAADLASY